MALDFSKLGAPSTPDTLLNPREIFSAIPDKDKKFSGYLRDVQTEVLNQWFTRRTESDLRLKMNTGGGKTVVGLLALKSCLNEGVGPAVYVAPTPYLASQVVLEAQALRLAVSDNPRALGVARGREILVTYIHVLLNGKSKFGVGTAGSEIPIGSMLIDDAHACLATAEQQFTLKLPATHPSYDVLFGLFQSDLEGQSSTGVMEVAEHNPKQYMLVPFWAWQDRLRTVEQEIHLHKDEEDIKFVWPLIKNHLRECRCVIGSGTIEISPRCLPVEMVPSFVRAKRRIFMSATFADDLVLVTDFNANPKNIATAIAPESASDIGERMILVPQELDTTITDEDIRTLAAKEAKDFNVVVIVPSAFRANFWADVADRVLTADNLEEGVAELRADHVGLVVVINKYDGIDLPQSACRVLILDGMPDARRAVDRIDQSHLWGSSIEISRSIQQLEQGMGRGVRATDDFCVVLLMGRSLTGRLFAAGAINLLTPATLAQFELAEKLAEQIRNQGIGEIERTMDYCLRRDAGWMRAARSALVSVKYKTASSDLSVAVARRSAFDLAASGDFTAAAGVLQSVVNATTDRVIRGWLMAEMAEYLQPTNAVEAQQIVKSANALNRQLLRPLAGIDYHRLSEVAGGQALALIKFLSDQYKHPNNLVIHVHAVANDLAFAPHSYKKFHTAMNAAARLMGYGAQLPESEYGAGPDVLWAVGGLRYFVIECKNEATTDTINKRDTNQLAGSSNWFNAKYDDTCSATPVMIHPSNVFEHAATPPPKTRIMTAAGLTAFREALIGCLTAVSKLTAYGDAKTVSGLLTRHQLLPDDFLKAYTIGPKVG